MANCRYECSHANSVGTIQKFMIAINVIEI